LITQEVTRTAASEQPKDARQAKDVPLSAIVDTKKGAKAEFRALVASTCPWKNSNELLVAYAGREDKLIKHLKIAQAEQVRMEMSQMVSAEIKGG